MWKPSGKSIKQLAGELGVNENRVRRAFYAWCDVRNVRPDRFMITRGPRKFRYDLPQKFVNDFSEAVRREKHVLLRSTRDGGFVMIVE